MKKQPTHEIVECPDEANRECFVSIQAIWDDGYTHNEELTVPLSVGATKRAALRLAKSKLVRLTAEVDKMIMGEEGGCK